MPNDVVLALTPGSSGLNLRDSPSLLDPTELADDLNWRISARSSLEKRRGFVDMGGSVGSTINELYSYTPSGGTSVVVAFAANGHVYTSPETGTWTSIDSGRANLVPGVVQFLDDLYYSNTTDGLIQRTGGSTNAIAAAPKGNLLAVWRQRLWVSGVPAHPYRVYWSGAGDPTNWTNIATNFVDLPFGSSDDAITGLYPGPNPGNAFDGSDGLLVFKRHATHRIINDADNTGGVVIGGQNILIDNGTGAVSQRVIVSLAGLIWFLAPDGVYTSDGVHPAVLRTPQLGGFLQQIHSVGAYPTAHAVAFNGSYLVSIKPQAQSTNTLVLEVYAQLPHRSDGGQPVTAMDLQTRAMTVFPDTAGPKLWFADAVSPATGYVRNWPSGGHDVTGSATPKAITAYARTGALNFGTITPKRLRRIVADARGQLTVGVVPDYDTTTFGEPHTFLNQTSDGPTWDDFNWDESVWGGAAQAIQSSNWYSQRGRRFTFALWESSTGTVTGPSRVGLLGEEQSDAALYSMGIKVTPLQAD